MKAYRRRFEDGATVIGAKLPHGINLADPCYPCVHISVSGDYFASIISVSDEFWSDAEEFPVDPVVAQIGKEKVEKLLAEQSEKVLRS